MGIHQIELFILMDAHPLCYLTFLLDANSANYLFQATVTMIVATCAFVSAVDTGETLAS